MGTTHWSVEMQPLEDFEIMKTETQMENVEWLTLKKWSPMTQVKAIQEIVTEPNRMCLRRQSGTKVRRE